MTVQVHPTAIIGNNVEIASNTVIGPHCIIEDDVKIGEGNIFMASIYIGRYTVIGDGNHFFPFSTIGVVPQDLKFKDEPTRLEIGNDNMIREHVTLHRGTGHGGGLSKIGSNNLIMVGGHVAHDCFVGNHAIISHGAALAGHVIVGDHATVGASSSVHQFCRVGDYAFIGGHSVVTQDAIPFVKTVGNRAKIYGINTIGLERKGFPKEEINNLRSAYRILFQKKMRLAEALEKLDSDYGECARVNFMTQFIKTAERGIVR